MYLHDECKMKTNCQNQHIINSSQNFREYNRFVISWWHTHQNRHVNKRRETHEKNDQKQILMRMSKHDCKNSKIENISQTKYQKKKQKKNEIENEKYDENNL